jgi:hypothetical protein
MCGVRFDIAACVCPEKMLQHKHIEGVAEQHKVLVIGRESSDYQEIRQFLHTVGCGCVLVSSQEATARIEQEIFDAVLIDLAHFEASPEQIILAINKVQPALLGRILLIIGTEPADGSYNLPNTSKEKPLSQLWAKLKKIFDAHPATDLLPQGMQIPQLIFDSFNAPMIAGIRGSSKSTRQLAYLHDSTTVNILTRLVEGVHQILLSGQVLDVSLRTVDGLPVLLRDRDKTLAQTTTTQFGEFGLQYGFVEHAGLQIQLADGSWIYMPLEHLNWRRNLT